MNKTLLAASILACTLMSAQAMADDDQLSHASDFTLSNQPQMLQEAWNFSSLDVTNIADQALQSSWNYTVDPQVEQYQYRIADNNGWYYNLVVSDPYFKKYQQYVQVYAKDFYRIGMFPISVQPVPTDAQHNPTVVGATKYASPRFLRLSWWKQGDPVSPNTANEPSGWTYIDLNQVLQNECGFKLDKDGKPMPGNAGHLVVEVTKPLPEIKADDTASVVKNELAQSIRFTCWH